VDIEGEDWALIAVRILIVLALADISLKLVELPIRSGAVEYWFKGMKYRTASVRKRQKVLVISSISILVISLSALSTNAVISSNRAIAALEESLTSEPVVSESVISESGTAVINPSQAIWLTGDSVILGIRNALSEIQPIIIVNARVGRQAPELLEEMQKDVEKAAGATVVMDLGNNDLLQPETVRAIFTLAKESPRIVVVNTAVPRPYKDPNNQIIEEVAREFSNVRVVDWNEISKDHPEYFAPDGVHLVPTGVTAYVMAINEALK
jgi:hypothetical protein